MDPNPLFTIDEDFIAFERTPDSTTLWSLGEESMDIPSLASPASLFNANFANVSPNPFAENWDNQQTWSRETPVLDRFRLGDLPTNYFTENQLNAVPPLENGDSTSMSVMDQQEQRSDFSYLNYEEIAAELDKLLESEPGENIIALEEGANPKYDASVQTEGTPVLTTHYTNWSSDPRESTCGSCNKPFYNIAVDAAARYVKRTEFKEETVRERELRTKAFFCGMETAVQMFSSPVLSQPVCCPGAVMREGAFMTADRRTAPQETPLSQGIVQVMW